MGHKAAQPKGVVNVVKKKGALDPVLVSHEASSSGTKDSDLAPSNFLRGHVVKKWIKKRYKKNNGKGKQKKEGVQPNNSFAGLENVGEEEKDIAEDAKGNSMAMEVTVGKDNVHTIVQTNNTFAGLDNVIEEENGETVETKGSLRDEGVCTTLGKEHVQTNNSFAGLEVQSVDHPKEKLDGSVATGKDSVLGSLVVVDKLQVSTLSVLQDISTDFEEDMSTFFMQFKTPSATSTTKAALSMAKDVTQQWSLPLEEKSGGGRGGGGANFRFLPRVSRWR
ncbi:hypothetical protein LIER_35775 [Lithospermum erythrorhizon]|uniref:Uncharacterized protein n=1 Tax=Lithospermum erythrorhizon TaxID=34254 RepID=A0AAV3P0W8_LITER